MSQENGKQNMKRNNKPTYNQRIMELEQEVSELRQRMYNLELNVYSIREGVSNLETDFLSWDEPSLHRQVMYACIASVATLTIIKLFTYILNLIF